MQRYMVSNSPVLRSSIMPKPQSKPTRVACMHHADKGTMLHLKCSKDKVLLIHVAAVGLVLWKKKHCGYWILNYSLMILVWPQLITALKQGFHQISGSYWALGGEWGQSNPALTRPLPPGMSFCVIHQCLHPHPHPSRVPVLDLRPWPETWQRQYKNISSPTVWWTIS